MSEVENQLTQKGVEERTIFRDFSSFPKFKFQAISGSLSPGVSQIQANSPRFQAFSAWHSLVGFTFGTFYNKTLANMAESALLVVPN
jgi:hypothetical protein